MIFNVCSHTINNSCRRLFDYSIIHGQRQTMQTSVRNVILIACLCMSKTQLLLRGQVFSASIWANDSMRATAGKLLIAELHPGTAYRDNHSGTAYSIEEPTACQARASSCTPARCTVWQHARLIVPFQSSPAEPQKTPHSQVTSASCVVPAARLQGCSIMLLTKKKLVLWGYYKSRLLAWVQPSSELQLRALRGAQHLPTIVFFFSIWRTTRSENCAKNDAYNENSTIQKVYRYYQYRQHTLR